MENKAHYSERLARNFTHGDWLLSSEALDLLSQNAGRRVSNFTLPTLLASGVRSQLLSPRRRVWLYDDVCGVVVSAAGRPRSRDENIPIVRAQYAYHDRQRKQKKQALHKKLSDMQY